MNPRLFSFVGGVSGSLKVTAQRTVLGADLPLVTHLEIVQGSVPPNLPDVSWVLSGVTSNERYVTTEEKRKLVEKQAPLGRPDSSCVVLIPLKKSSTWWDFPQSERRSIFEERSHHIQLGLKYLPEVARRLHHCRDLPDAAGFDFVTLFDFPHSATAAFKQLLQELRATEEWEFVEREVEIWLSR